MSHEIPLPSQHSWDMGSKKLSMSTVNNKISFSVAANGEESSIAPQEIVGIPKTLLTDHDKVKKYLDQCYLRLVQLEDKQYKLYVMPKMLGGANIINAEAEPGKLWPNGVVPYEIDSTKYPVAQEQRKVILQAILEWNNAGTGFQFVPHTNQRDYLIFGEEPNACYSNVGRVGGPQYIRCNLTGGFNKTSIMHEIGHAIGFYHEQQRLDRDNYVTVTPLGLAQAVNYGKMGRSHGNYDPGSIMHYYFDEKMKPKPIITNPEYAGRTSVLSEGDKQAAAYLYQQSSALTVPGNPNVTPIAPQSGVQLIGYNMNATPYRRPEWQRLRNKANNYYRDRQYGDAFNHAVTLIMEYDGYLSNDLQSEVYNLCGLCALNSQNYDLALPYFKKAHEFDPTSRVIANNILLTQEAKANQWQCVLV